MRLRNRFLEFLKVISRNIFIVKNEQKPFVWFESELGGHFEPNNFEILDRHTFVTWHLSDVTENDRTCDPEKVKIFYPKMVMDQSHSSTPIMERIRRVVNWLGFDSNLLFCVYLFCLFYFFKFYRSDFTRDILPRHSETRKKLSFGNIPPRRK